MQFYWLRNIVNGLFNGQYGLVITLSFLTLAGYQCCYAQTITKASLSGTVYADSGKALSGVVVTAEHLPSATRYVTISYAGGKYVLPNLRIGGPYRISARLSGYPEVVSYITKFTTQDYFDYPIYLSKAPISLQEVLIKAGRNPVLKNDATTFSVDQSLINRLPTINRRLQDIMRLSPFAFGTGIIGTNPRFNSFAIDGSLLITYGLGSTIVVGNTTGTDPIGLDAIEELQVNVAPFDVRESGFTGAGINIITKKGDNHFKASAFDYFNTGYLDGNKIQGTPIKAQTYQQYQAGLSIGGPVVKDKLFYQFNYEKKSTVSPATNYVAYTGGLPGPNTTRVLAADLNNLSDFLKNTYQYITGPYQGYDQSANNDKVTAQLDWNLNEKSSVGLRVLYLNSRKDASLDNSNFVGIGGRNNTPYSMSYQNSDWSRHSNALSARLEFSSKIRDDFAQQFTLSYAHLPEYRKILGELKPLVDILDGDKNYISFGSDVFAQNNNIATNIYQLQEHFNIHAFKHNFLAGFDANLIQVQNTFTPVSQGYYLFNSLSDFYNSTPAGTITPIGTSSGSARPALFEKGYSLLPDQQMATARLGYAETGIYLQDNWAINEFFKITPGLRLDRYYFIGNPINNSYVSSLMFQQPSGVSEQLNTGQLPPDQFKLSPRIGFTLRFKKTDILKIHGGTGIFSGRLPTVLLGSQFTTNGLLNANLYTQNTQNYPFRFSPDAYTPTSSSNNASYDIVMLDKKFKYPQTLKNNLSFDFYLKNNWILSLEGLYNRDINAFYVRNANIDNTQLSINTDGRERLLNNAINTQIVQHAYVVDNTNGGRQYALSINAKKTLSDDFYIFVNYTYGNSKDKGSFTGTEPTSEFIGEAVAGNPNKPQLAYSSFDQKHRFFVFLSKSYHFTSNSMTSFSTFSEVSQSGRFSYTYAGNGDVNGDGVPGNDLIFVPANRGQINLVPYTDANGNFFSKEVQWQALEQFIQRSAYLRSRQGRLAERNGDLLPFNVQVDAKIAHELKLKSKNAVHVLQLSVDLINLPNLINSHWGVKYLPANTQPIEAVTHNTFKVFPANLNNEYTPNTSLLSIWQLQFGVKYSFGY